jgi:hypothetical protein
MPALAAPHYPNDCEQPAHEPEKLLLPLHGVCGYRLHHGGSVADLWEGWVYVQCQARHIQGQK